MANNDSILIDGLIDDLVENDPDRKKRGQVFEEFATEQIIKDYSLSKDDILSGIVDGRDDGGIDFAYIFVNGHYVNEPSNFFWPKSSVEIEVYLITCKHHDTFKQAPLDNMVATFSEMFELKLDPSQFIGSYSKKLIDFREKLKFTYRKTSSKVSKLTFNLRYLSRGYTKDIGDSVISRAKQANELIENKFTGATANFEFIGSTELINLHRKLHKFFLELPFIEVLSRGERYILLSHIEDFYNFIKNDEGKLRRYLFNSNVRDYMGLNRVNEDIKNTLNDISSPDFWCLNNGITILASTAKVVGDSIYLEDIQIVNGLQTSESIYNYFNSGLADPNKRAVLIRIIVTDDEDFRDSIIKATNNQTAVEISALHSTDKIQKDIEEILLRYNYYYERRTNYYINQSIERSLIIQPLYIASGYLSLIRKQPFDAATLKNKSIRDTYQYNFVFNEKADLHIWPQIVKILKITDHNLDKFRRPRGNTENFIKRWRHVLSFLVISRLIGNFNFAENDIVKLDVSLLTPELLKESWEFIIHNEIDPSIGKKYKNKQLILSMLSTASEVFKIANYESISKRTNILQPKYNTKVLSKDFIESVDSLLPEQPWKPGAHALVAKMLKCSNAEIFKATEILITQGRRMQQKDGILYDPSGSIVAIDNDRVDETTLMLK